MIFSLKKCGIVEYGAVLTDRVREWGLQGGKVLEGKVYKYSVSVFVQLSSNGRTGIFSMVISWKFAQGPGAQFAFFLLGHHFCLRLTLRTFYFLHGSLLEPGRDPVDD
jgi:hypothetical protein